MKLEVRNAEARDLTAVKRLIDEYIAADYYSLDELEALLHGDRHLFYVVTDADRDGAVVSFFYGFISALEEALPLLHVTEKPDALAEYPPDTPVGVYKTASTEKDYQKLGICSSFIRDLEPVLRERGAKLILATALRPLGREVPMRHIFRDNGFEAVAEISRPWVDMLLYCPYCQKNHCICDAVFYMKKLDEKEDKRGE
ncbi:MAG: hypothetical protein E7576_16715 [Ruminococcaceae bacterium]|jgi:GNAT superfamily N-acetyltransferase|nr:hypothetical protein [Oscillospiraceae bacterium]